MLVELHSKGGSLCQQAKDGAIHCPLLVRPTSEDVVTGTIVEALRVLNPRLWVSHLLNQALGAERFRPQVYRRFQINPWVNQNRYPRELLPFTEGSTQVDVCLSWNNPPTTVFIEAKLDSDLTPKSSNDKGTHGFPSDQLIRNARVGLHSCGYFGGGRLFDVMPRDFALIMLSPRKGHPLVQQYRDPQNLRSSIPHSEQLTGLPPLPFIGSLGYDDVVSVLRSRIRLFTRPERRVIEHLTEYLDFKRLRSRRPLAVVD